MSFVANENTSRKKQVIVLGAGIIGTTTAYYLAEQGYDVTVVDRHDGVGQETSFANGAQLCYSCIYPLNTDPQERGSAKSELTNFRNNLFRQSASELNLLIQKTHLSFPFQASGILQLFFTEQEFIKAKHAAKYKSDHGIPLTILSPDACREQQETLLSAKRKMIGGILMHQDAIGDAYLFTKGLAGICKNLGVKFLFKTEIEKAVAGDKKIAGLVTKDNTFLKADIYVICFGVHSKAFLAPLGIDLAMKFVKGYSLSIDLDAIDKVPAIGIADPGSEIFFAKLNKSFRVAGLTEEVDMDLSINPTKVTMLVDAVDSLFPHLNVREKDRCGKVHKWACLRPSSENKVPFISGSKFENLWLNTGHGGYGWTLAPASAKLLVDLVKIATSP